MLSRLVLLEEAACQASHTAQPVGTVGGSCLPSKPYCSAGWYCWRRKLPAKQAILFSRLVLLEEEACQASPTVQPVGTVGGSCLPNKPYCSAGWHCWRKLPAKQAILLSWLALLEEAACQASHAAQPVGTVGGSCLPSKPCCSAGWHCWRKLPAKQAILFSRLVLLEEAACQASHTVQPVGTVGGSCLPSKPHCSAGWYCWRKLPAKQATLFSRLVLLEEAACQASHTASVHDRAAM